MVSQFHNLAVKLADLLPDGVLILYIDHGLAMARVDTDSLPSVLILQRCGQRPQRQADQPQSAYQDSVARLRA